MNYKKISAFAEMFRVHNPRKFRIKDTDPGYTWKFKSKEEARGMLEEGVARLCGLQDKLYAQDRWGVLLIFQAMDAAGKDGTIKHVMSGINPQGCEVYSFKSPNSTELDHDYLWRCLRCMPERGRIGIFNRSYYEETLVVRVHPDYLAAEKVPQKLVTKQIWQHRFEDINAMERYYARNGFVIRKFFLNVSKKEQKKRFLSRVDESAKNWKFSAADAQERLLWDDYMVAYEDMIRNTSTDHAPWYVIPADNKWFTRMAVASVVIDTLKSLDLAYPEVSPAMKKELAAAKKVLLAEK